MPTTKRTIKEMLDENEFELPIGYTDSEGNFHKTVLLREMTGEVEEAIADPKLGNNFAKIITATLEGIVERIGNKKSVRKEDVRNMYAVDRDFLFLMNHKVSLGDEIEWIESCERCGDRFDVSVNIDDIEVTYLEKDEPKIYEFELPKGITDAEGKVYRKIKIGLPTGFHQEQLFKTFATNAQQGVTQLLALTTEDIEGLSHWNFETFRKMSIKDRKFLQKKLAEIKIGADMSPHVSCPNCGHAYKAQIPLGKLLGE